MVYLFLYNRSYGDAEEVRERLNGLDVIDEIRELFPYSFFLSSDGSVSSFIGPCPFQVSSLVHPET